MSDRPLAALPEDEKIVLTALRDAVARSEQPLTVLDVQRLTWWPSRTGVGREFGRRRGSRALRSLAERGLASRTRLDVYRYHLNERGWLAWGGGEIKRQGAGWVTGSDQRAVALGALHSGGGHPGNAQLVLTRARIAAISHR